MILGSKKFEEIKSGIWMLFKVQACYFVSNCDMNLYGASIVQKIWWNSLWISIARQKFSNWVEDMKRRTSGAINLYNETTIWNFAIRDIIRSVFYSQKQVDKHYIFAAINAVKIRLIVLAFV